MAKCDLSIELDDPQKIYSGGAAIKGVIRVDVDADVKCSGLVVTSGWKTHGRGNVDSGEVGSVTVFEGEWRTGEKLEYRFELPVGHWPPTYHGHYLNVDHCVEARAKIPWAFDPKASQQFMMRPSCGPEGTVNEQRGQKSSAIGNAIGVLVVLGFLIGGAVMVSQAGAFGLLFLLFPLAGGMYWFIRHFLPKFALGEVDFHLAQEQASPGESIAGELVVRPRNSVPINAIQLNFEAREKVVSGSGSNRTTHSKTFFEESHTLQESTSLTPGQEHCFPFEVALPENAPYSIDLSDNDLIWNVKLRVDIPRWPDWVKSLDLQVVPSGKQAIEPAPVAAPVSTPAAASDGITFGETVRHLDSVRGQRDQLETLVDAVKGMTFEMEAIVERRLLYSGDDDPHVYEDGYAVWAHYTDPELPMVLYVPHELADEFEHMGQAVCSGRGTIVGWDHLHERLQIKLERPA
ncbi:MAG: sporulation protein [Rubripirellula sp.]